MVRQACARFVFYPSPLAVCFGPLPYMLADERRLARGRPVVDDGDRAEAGLVVKIVPVLFFLKERYGHGHELWSGGGERCPMHRLCVSACVRGYRFIYECTLTRKLIRESSSTQPKSSSAFHVGTAVLSSRPVVLLTPRRSAPTVTMA